MRIIYSFNKLGYEAACWEREIRAASDENCTFIPFNHGTYLDPNSYLNAWELDHLYRTRHPALLKMYGDLETCIRQQGAEMLFVTNCPPYHPDFLRRLTLYRALYSTDDPDATYRRNIPYLHAYHHVFYCDPAYSHEIDMQEKMRECGMVNADWLPLAVFDFECDPTQTVNTIFTKERDIDVIYIGGFWRQKIATLTKIRRALGRRFQLYGFFRLKHNLYMNVHYGYGAWIRPVSFQERVKLYQRAKIGFNIHWNEYGLGNQRLYHLPANGVMQICDCPKHLDRIFKVGEEVIAYRDTDDLIAKLFYYLAHAEERQAIARQGYQRTMRDYRFGVVARRAAELMQRGMEQMRGRLNGQDSPTFLHQPMAGAPER